MIVVVIISFFEVSLSVSRYALSGLKVVEPLHLYDYVLLSCQICIQCESTLSNFLNVKELLPRNRQDILNLSDCNGIPIHKHLVHKQTYNL